MAEKYTHQLLRVVVAQVCQTIGWHSIQSTPLELLIDILDQYLRDITRLTHRYAELYNRTDPNLDDVALAYQETGMNLTELQEYLQFVDPIERPFEVPRYPLPKDSHLNFLKPGSKEVLTRPVHIPEHMPPMLVDSEEEQEEARRRMQRHREALLIDAEEDDAMNSSTVDVKPEYDEVIEKMEEVGAEEVAMMETSQNEEVVTFKRPPEVTTPDGATEIKKPRTLTEEGRPTREISSVIMTTSGFISPAREGKLPDSKPPVIPEEKPKPPPPPPPAPAPVLPVAKIDEKFNKKPKKKPVEKDKKKDKKGDKKKDGNEPKAPSRPPTPAAPAEPASTAVEDIKPIVVEQPPKPPAPVPDVKPPEPQSPAQPPLPPPPPAVVPPEPQEKVTPPAPVPIVPPPAKPKKEKPKRKKPPQSKQLKSPLPPPMIPGQLMDISLFSPPPPQPQPSLLQPLPIPVSVPSLPPAPATAPLLNQITPPKPPKPKRPKLTKKQRQQQQQMEQMMQFQQPLSAQNILDMFSPGKKPLPGIFPPSLFPPQQLQQQQLPPPKFPDNSAQTQLDILQKLHPSLEITPAPGPGLSMHSPSPDKHKLNIFKKVAKKEPTPSPTLTPQGPIIVIDDDKSPPHLPQFPITPTVRKRAPKSQSSAGFPFQDTLSSPDVGFSMAGLTPGEHSGLASTSFREFSPPKTPSNMPKTPDIKLQSSSSSSTSWMSDSGKLSAGPGPLFGDFPNFGLPQPVVPKEEKKKKPRQRQPKQTAAAKKAKNAQLLEGLELLQQQLQQQQQQMPPSPISGLDKKQLSEYSKLLNQAMPPGFLGQQVRNPGMFGMFPLPSGPGLIPDNPLFNTFPGQHSFLPTGPFGMPPIPPRFDINNLLRHPRPPKVQPVDSFDHLDPETKLAHTPLDLQKSTCNVAPLVPPSLQIEPVATTSGRASKQPSPAIPRTPTAPPQEHSLNLSTKSSVITPNPTIPPQPVPVIPQQSSEPVVITAASTLMASQQHQHQPPPQQLAAAAPTVPPITPGETIVIGSDSDTNSQSTVTMAAMGISPPSASQGASAASKKDKLEKRKNKEHKKDKKLKEGKIKKKKDKKDKNKSKDRDRERPKSSHSIHPDVPVGPPAVSAPINPEIVPEPLPAAAPMDFSDSALQDQVRRKEKKEKKKEKLKKEKRKEKERAAAAALEAASTSFGFGTGLNPGVGSAAAGADQRESSEGSAVSVPKLMLKLGSNATPSPRSGTPDHPVTTAPDAGSTGDVKREASPELARFTALVTRPPKLKTPGGKGKLKDEDGGKMVKSGDHTGKAAGKLDFSGDSSKQPRPRGIQALPDSIDLFSVTPSHTPVQPSKVSPGLAGAASVTATAGPSAAAGSGDPTAVPHSSKKPPKEPKSSKSHSSSVSASLGVTIPAPLNTPINVKDADGNVVWICPACGRVDDGTPMIGCDGCDAWYHWVCVGIQVPPDSNEDWYCRVCIGRKQESHGDEKQKKRKKKDKRNPKD